MAGLDYIRHQKAGTSTSQRSYLSVASTSIFRAEEERPRYIWHLAAGNWTLPEQGADIHTRDNMYRGWNPLHVESRNGHLDVVRLLLDKGAAVDIRSENQQTPLAEASSEGQSCMHGISRAGPQHTSHRYTDMLR